MTSRLLNKRNILQPTMTLADFSAPIFRAKLRRFGFFAIDSSNIIIRRSSIFCINHTITTTCDLQVFRIFLEVERLSKHENLNLYFKNFQILTGDLKFIQIDAENGYLSNKSQLEYAHNNAFDPVISQASRRNLGAENSDIHKC